MVIATNDDIVRLFPGIQDHSVVEILAMGTTVDELEGVSLLLQGNDKELIDTESSKGSRLNFLLEILANTEIQLRDELET